MNITTQSQTKMQTQQIETKNAVSPTGNTNKPQQQHNSTDMNPPTTARTPSPDGSRDYDVTRMREEDFERLAVYIVPDVQCERGISNRADKTLPRSLTLKPSMVFSSPNVKVSLT